MAIVAGAHLRHRTGDRRAARRRGTPRLATIRWVIGAAAVLVLATAGADQVEAVAAAEAFGRAL